jgi:hypothetical protein
MRRFLTCWAGLLAVAAPLDAAEPVNYLRDVKPVLQARCYACHGALKQKSKLRLDTAAFARKGGRRGPAVVPGKVADSLLIERVADTDEASRMPPQGKPLTEQQIALLRAWIDHGAQAPADEKSEADPGQHWAFQKPIRPPLPAEEFPSSSRNPVDVFLAAEYARHHLAPSPPADRSTLLRRVYLDLIGLPPTRAELRAFLADSSPGAYERVVDRLLASPQYGERWGRHWMDVWRYSDWYGRRSVPDVMNSYPQIWRWRDWIARSLNEDRGYDQMILAMLAADEIWPEDDESLAATGFLVRNWFKWNYNQWMRDNVEHTGKAFLGLTLNCCHCHDHKYDPITQEEYFQFRAFFEPLELRHDRVAGEPDPGPFQKYVYGKAYGPITSGRIRVFDEKLDAPTFIYTGGDERNRVEGQPPVLPGVPAALGGDRLKIEPVSLPPPAWYPGLQPFVQQEEIAKRQRALESAQAALRTARTARMAALRLRVRNDEAEDLPKRTATTDNARLAVDVAEAQMALARSDLACLQARIAADRVVYLGAKGDVQEVTRTASHVERQFNVDAAILAQREAIKALVLARRNAATKPAQLQALEKRLTDAEARLVACRKEFAAPSQTYTPMSPIYPRTSTGRRTALARWIASPDNPLTARVAVNHLWNWHFGQPLVETTANFGRSGQRPSHPDLLDFLAVELMENGWQLKGLHRLIVTSDAYRMRSHFDEADVNQKADPDNRLLWHFPVQRMEAEVVRDSLLHTAGELDLHMGGPELPQEQGLTSRRRSLYFAHHGETRMEFLELFDVANTCEAYRRTSSVRPQQALALSNSELARHEGRILARKLWQTVPAKAAEPVQTAAFVQAAFEQVLGRAPTSAEERVSTAFLLQQTERFRQSQEELHAAAKEAGTASPSTDPAERARENLIRALFNHNDFVTIR